MPMPSSGSRLRSPSLSRRFLSAALACVLALWMIPAVPGIARADDGADHSLLPCSARTGGAGDAVSVVFTNDVHCAIDAGDGCLGYVGVAAFVGEALEECGSGNVSVVDAGDAVQGGPVGTLSDGEAIVEIMNAVGYDYAVPGDHEFDYGMDQFERLSGLSDATYLSCNFVDKRTGDAVLAPYAIETYSAAPASDDADGRLTVAFVGISTPETLTKSSPVLLAASVLVALCALTASIAAVRRRRA